MHVTVTSPTVGLRACYPCATPTGPSDARWRRYRHGVRSAPVHARVRGLHPDKRSRGESTRSPQHRSAAPAATRLSLDDVINMAEYRREVTSQQSRRIVLEEAHRALRNESLPDRSRPHSVMGPGLQALTSPMPSPSRAGQMDHIPALLPLPSDRTFIPSQDQHHDRHVTNTPIEHFRLQEDCSPHPVARQCCEIMGPSLCRSCRRLESRAQNRKSAELECPRMRSAGGRGRQTFSLTQVVKRSYPRLSDAEIQDKLARGEIARLSFPWLTRPGSHGDEHSETIRNTDSCCSSRNSVSDKEQNSQDDDDDDDDEAEEEDKDILHINPGTYRANSPPPSPTSCTVTGEKAGHKAGKLVHPSGDTLVGATTVRQQFTKASLSTKNTFYMLAKLALKLQGTTTTPLFFSDLRGMQGKILSGSVDRKAYMTLRPDAAAQRNDPKDAPSRLKSAVSSASTSSGKSGLSKLGSQLSREFMPAFVSPRKVKLIEEPKYKVFFEPPLLTKRRQIPNPSFFAGSTDEYSLPERLPDVIEFADSQRIATMEKQIRSGSALSFVSSMSDEQQQQQQCQQQQQQQQQQIPDCPAEKLTSLPLDKEEDVASSKGSRGERGVSTPTPRSTMRVSSGGPLSSRTVPEENEEDLQRDLRELDQVVAVGDHTNDDTKRTIEESASTRPKESKTRLGNLDETSSEPQTNVEGKDLYTGVNEILENEEGSTGIATDELSGSNRDYQQQTLALQGGNELDDSKLGTDPLLQEEHLNIAKDALFCDEMFANRNANYDNAWSPFFLTDRELNNQLESQEEEGKVSSESVEGGQVVGLNDSSEANSADVADKHGQGGESDDSVAYCQGGDSDNKSGHSGAENEGKWWSQ